MIKKICCRCKIEKSCENFSKNSHHKDGLQSACKICKRKENKSHYDKNKKQYLDKANINSR